MRHQRRDLGIIEGCGTDTTVRLERDMEATPLEVWQSLTEPAAMTDWLQATAEIEPRPGGMLTLRFTNTDTTIRGHVVRFDVPKVLEYTWQMAGEPESIVRFELHPIPRTDRTRLLLTHTHCNSGDAASFAAGWHHHLEMLATQLTGQQPSWDWARYNTLFSQYGTPEA